MTDTDLEHIREVSANADLIYSKAQVDAAYDRIAADITAKLADRDPLIICILLGGLIPMGQIIQRLAFPFQIDYLHATRYRGATTGGALQWFVPPRYSLQGRTVLLIDDILDEGLTLAAICEACKDAGAREVLTAALLEKRHTRKNDIEANFVGLEVEDRYVFGCGMDYKGYLRNLPAIYALNEDA